MKILILILLVFILEPSIFASVDMTDTKSISKSLGLNEDEYIYLMALSGILSGAIMNMFLWKMR